MIYSVDGNLYSNIIPIPYFISVHSYKDIYQRHFILEIEIH